MATSIGDVAARILSRGRTGEVTRVFQHSAYVRSGSDYLLLLWGELRSPMTINIEGGKDIGWRIKAGEGCVLSKDAVLLDAGEIDVRGAEVFRSALLDRRKVSLPRGSTLAAGVAVLRSMYDVSPSGPTLVGDPALRTFIRRTLLPLSTGRYTPVYSPASYSNLIGRGGGFTPAGDDFVGGFLANFNYVARCRKSRQVRLPRALIRGRTVPESGVILSQSARGNVDEGMASLIVASTGGSASFYDELVAVARRGHTSGIDMSLGVLLCDAALGQAEGQSRLLQKCLDVLWKP